MARRFSAIATVVALGLPATQAAAQTDDGLSIMRPEPTTPGTVPVYRSPPALNRPVPQPLQPMPQLPSRAEAPSPLLVPRTGQVISNLPAASGGNPGGRETMQDRATRCIHQAGSAGAAGGDRNAYIGSCVTQ